MIQSMVLNEAKYASCVIYSEVMAALFKQVTAAVLSSYFLHKNEGTYRPIIIIIIVIIIIGVCFRSGSVTAF